MHGPLNIVIIVILNLLVVILSVWLFLHILKDPYTENETTDEPVEILKKRLARGEIDYQEFEEMKKKLAG